jgi:hypothetical protein
VADGVVHTPLGARQQRRAAATSGHADHVQQAGALEVGQGDGVADLSV